MSMSYPQLAMVPLVRFLYTLGHLARLWSNFIDAIVVYEELMPSIHLRAWQ